MAVFHSRTLARYAPWFWGMVVLNFVVPFTLLASRRLRSMTTATVSSVCVLVGMWLERYLIVVPTLANPRLPAASGSYAPTWIEVAITAATFSAMVMLYMIFSKLFPIIAVWEYKPHPPEDED
jgi:molybdopterin-containing oxidoreductase family membrane subunit